MLRVTKIITVIIAAVVVGLALIACGREDALPTPTVTQTPPPTATTSPLPTSVPSTSYVGSKACSQCHPTQYGMWQASGHPYILRDSNALGSLPLPLPAGYDSKDISYVVGGYKWKANYLDSKGFIITSSAGKPGKNQYNLQQDSWADFLPGQTRQYDCGSCHSTGYSLQGQQDGLPGIKGAWVSPGIQCEACHGPGQRHVAEGGKKTLIKVDRSAKACALCHSRGEPDKIPAEEGFIANHAQYNELLSSPHKFFDCVTCHNPHPKAKSSIVNDCTGCHTQAANRYYGSTMQGAGVQCTDCHMPRATRSAAEHNLNEGDMRTHLFRINTSGGAPTLADAGAFFQPYISLQFACLQCHQGRNLMWAQDYARGIHALGKGTAPVTPTQPQPSQETQTPTPRPTLTPTPAPAPTPTPIPTPTPTRQGPPPVPANHSTSGCAVCHEKGLAGAPSWPGDHAGRPEATCTGCHSRS